MSILGFSVEEIQNLGDNLLSSLIHPDDYKKLIDFQQKVAQSSDKQSHDLEYRMLHKNGSWHYFLDRSSVFKRDTQGTAIQIIGTGINRSI